MNENKTETITVSAIGPMKSGKTEFLAEVIRQAALLARAKHGQGSKLEFEIYVYQGRDTDMLNKLDAFSVDTRGIELFVR